MALSSPSCLAGAAAWTTAWTFPVVGGAAARGRRGPAARCGYPGPERVHAVVVAWAQWMCAFPYAWCDFGAMYVGLLVFTPWFCSNVLLIGACCSRRETGPSGRGPRRTRLCPLASRDLGHLAEGDWRRRRSQQASRRRRPGRGVLLRQQRQGSCTRTRAAAVVHHPQRLVIPAEAIPFAQWCRHCSADHQEARSSPRGKRWPRRRVGSHPCAVGCMVGESPGAIWYGRDQVFGGPPRGCPLREQSFPEVVPVSR
jgi:hypothetical protein